MGYNKNPRRHGTNSGYAAGCRCPDCTRAHAEYHGDYMRRVGRPIESARRQETRARLAQIKIERGCVDCGYNAHDVALDFDHRPNVTKRFTMSRAWGYPWATILAEIDKCDVVCSNCHRIRTFDRQRQLADDGWD